jgi:hypothetical protein
VLRNAPAVAPSPPIANRHIERWQAQLHQERVAFERWMIRLRRAGNEVAKRQKRIARLERQLARRQTG